MEFVQFHPTGMVWPPSVQGILVTEGVRGEGGVLRNKEGKRFMFDDIPANYKTQTADNEEEGWRYTQGDKSARRPPELLTRDHVARCIRREVKEGRGSPHGGVFLDIAWIKEKLPNAAEHIKKKLPSMYHQFKQLADIDITQEPMEIGPTTHYMMGGVQVDAESQMSTRARPVRGGRMRRGIARSQSAGREFALRSAGVRQARRRIRREVRQGTTARGRSTTTKWRKPREGRSSRSSAAPLGGAENPFAIQHELQDMMQDLVGIVRREEEMERALEGIEKLKVRAAKAGIGGNREYNNGWHTALDLNNLLTVSEIVTRAALSAKRAAARISATIIRRRANVGAGCNLRVTKAPDGSVRVEEVPVKADAAGTEAGDRGAKVNTGVRSQNGNALFRIWRGDATAADSSTTRPKSRAAWWCSTWCIAFRPRRPTIWRCAGIARPASAGRARRKSTASRA